MIGDLKSPSSYDAEDIDFLSISDQIKVFPEFAKILPTSRYSRKNIGYLYAIMRFDSGVIIETDDDNRPYNDFPIEFSLEINGDLLYYGGWGNVYGLFTKQNIWPRGLPLDCINIKDPLESSKETCICPVRQYLADGDPDVDAIYRLVIPQKEITFDQRNPIILAGGSFCPFNSQNTVWFPEAYELMYLPSYTSFRMTDIWRSFVAQICLHAVGMNLSFHSATVYQDRNIHNLIQDFTDEIPGYLQNRKIIDALQSLQLSNDVNDMGLNLLKCWEALFRIGIVPYEEIVLCEAWLKEIKILKTV